MLLIICLYVAAADQLYLRAGLVPGNGSPELPYWSLAAALAVLAAGPTELLILGPNPLLIVHPGEQPVFGDSLQSDLLVR